MIKAKLRVESVRPTTQENKTVAESVSLNAVYSEDKTSENYSYSQATPSARLEMHITNPAAFGFFQEGKEYLVNFELA